MRRLFPTLCIAFALAGCISTPNTKALITPIGAAGYHTFAPKEPSQPIDVSEIDRIAAAGAAESERMDQDMP